MGRFAFSDVATMAAAISRILFTQEYLHVVALVTEYIFVCREREVQSFLLMILCI